MLTSSTQLQNRSLHVVEWTRTSSKCQKKKKKCTCKACKNTVFHCQICKFVRFLLPSSSWLLKFPNREFMNMQRLLQRKRNSKTELDLAIWNFSTIDMLYKMGEVFIPLITEMVLMWRQITATTSRPRQNLKFEMPTSSFGTLSQKIAPKSVPHVQHDFFHSFNQSYQWCVALSLPLPSSFRWLPILSIPV